MSWHPKKKVFFDKNIFARRQWTCVDEKLLKCLMIKLVVCISRCKMLYFKCVCSFFLYSLFAISFTKTFLNLLNSCYKWNPLKKFHSSMAVRMARWKMHALLSKQSNGNELNLLVGRWQLQNQFLALWTGYAGCECDFHVPDWTSSQMSNVFSRWKRTHFCMNFAIHHLHFNALFMGVRNCLPFFSFALIGHAATFSWYCLHDQKYHTFMCHTE